MKDNYSHIGLVQTHELAKPEYKTKYSSGIDTQALGIIKFYDADNNEADKQTLQNLNALLEQNHSIELKQGERMLIDPGYKLAELPPLTEAQIRPRSGLSLKQGVIAILGTIDEDYRGTPGVILTNTSKQPFHFKKGDHIGQLVVVPILRPNVIWKEETSTIDSDRGNAGFGSTGK